MWVVLVLRKTPNSNQRGTKAKAEKPPKNAGSMI
jgi:hypothetical protein